VIGVLERLYKPLGLLISITGGGEFRKLTGA
jgi:hypothetical protein